MSHRFIKVQYIKVLSGLEIYHVINLQDIGKKKKKITLLIWVSEVTG